MCKCKFNKKNIHLYYVLFASVFVNLIKFLQNIDQGILKNFSFNML